MNILIVMMLTSSFAGADEVSRADTKLERDKVEKPLYSVLESREGYEIRKYSGYIVAEVLLTGKESNAMNRGFRPLADFIFGNNQARDKIPMTSPVTQKTASSEKIPMTAPVIQQATEEEQAETPGISVAFIMPGNYSIDTLPVPNNIAVKIREVPERYVAALKFSGLGSVKTMKEKEKMLKGFLARDNISFSGNATYARYDPPWTLPFMRRNEVWFDLTNYEVKTVL